MSMSYLKSKCFYLPTLMFLLFLAVNIILLNLGETRFGSLTSSLIQWDAEHYLSISSTGYEKFECDFDANYICGNIGWFPLLPIIASMINSLGIESAYALLFVSWISLWLALLIIFQLASKLYSEKTATFSLVALLLFPGSFYFLTGFPYSLYLLILSLIFFFLQSQKFAPVILLSGLLAVTYPSGSLIGLPLLYLLIKNYRSYDTKNKLLLSLSMLSIVVAITIYFIYNWIKFNDFLLYVHFQSQSYYAHDLSFPLVTIYNSLTTLQLTDPIAVSLIFTLLVALIFYKKEIPISWQILMFGVLLFTPTMGTTTSYYRHIIIAMPLFVMIGSHNQTKKELAMFACYCLVALYLNWSVFMAQYKLGQLM